MGFFLTIILPTRQIEYKRINFAPFNKSIEASKLFQPIWNDFYNGFKYLFKFKLSIRLPFE